jgi:hypothetical protein
MTEKPVEGNTDPDEGNVPTTPLPETTQPLQGDVASLLKRLDDQDARLRALQSEKDKRWDKEVMPTIKKVAEMFNIPVEKVREVQRNAMLDKLIDADTLSATPTIGTSQEQTAKVDVQHIISEFGLNANDPDVLKAITEKEPSIALGKIAVARAKQPSPTTLQSPPPSGTPVAPKNEQALLAELQKLQKTPSKNMERMKEIEKELGW